MTSSEFAADSLVRAYLRARTLPEAVHRAVVSMAHTRLLAGRMPVLDAMLRSDIDKQATAPPGSLETAPARPEQPLVYFVPAAAYWSPASPHG